MAGVTHKTTGLKELQHVLRQLPDKVQRKVVRKALTKAATPILSDARKRVPVGDGLNPDGSTRKNLKKNLVKTAMKVAKGNKAVAYVVAGPRARETPHAWLVHNGTAPHQIILENPLILGNTFLPAGTVINHPGTEPVPFLAQAVNVAGPQSQKIVRDELAVGIEKEAALLAGGV